MGQQQNPVQNSKTKLDMFSDKSSSNSRWGFLQLGGLIVSGTSAYFAEELIRNGTTFTAADLANSKFGSALGLDQTGLATNNTELLPLAMGVAVLAALYFAILVKEDLHNTVSFGGAERTAAATIAAQP